MAWKSLVTFPISTTWMQYDKRICEKTLQERPPGSGVYTNTLDLSYPFKVNHKPTIPQYIQDTVVYGVCSQLNGCPIIAVNSFRTKCIAPYRTYMTFKFDDEIGFSEILIA